MSAMESRDCPRRGGWIDERTAHWKCATRVQPLATTRNTNQQFDPKSTRAPGTASAARRRRLTGIGRAARVRAQNRLLTGAGVLLGIGLLVHELLAGRQFRSDE